MFLWVCSRFSASCLIVVVVLDGGVESALIAIPWPSSPLSWILKATLSLCVVLVMVCLCARLMSMHFAAFEFVCRRACLDQ